MKFRQIIGLLVGLNVAVAQDYPDYADYADGGDYGQDSLYQDYAKKQAEKAEGGGGLGKLVLAGGVGWLVGGKVHSGRAAKKLKKKHTKEAKDLYTQYYNDVYKMQEVILQLEEKIQQEKQKAELEALQRDYDEFKQPDVDGDDRISRAEFEMYVKNYLSNYPGLDPKDYPKFNDFDHDNDGYIGFTEYVEQMALQVKQKEMEDKVKQKTGQKTNDSLTQALKGLYKETKKTNNFDDLYANLGS